MRGGCMIQDDLLVSFNVLISPEMNETCIDDRARSATLLGIFPPR